MKFVRISTASEHEAFESDLIICKFTVSPLFSIVVSINLFLSDVHALLIHNKLR